MRYGILLALAIIALVSANELGFGVIVFVPLMLLAYWLMEKFIMRENKK